MKPTTSGSAGVNSIRLYHKIYGRGEPLLLIHGRLTTSTGCRMGATAGRDKAGDENASPVPSRRAGDLLATFQPRLNRPVLHANMLQIWTRISRSRLQPP